MFERLHQFEAPSQRTIVALPFDLEAWVAEWTALRGTMIRSVPEPFTRDEWAYLVTFLDPDNLRRPFQQAFGAPSGKPGAAPDVLARPRGPVAVWLPNNVSLLGPLTLVLISLTGNPVRLKAGSQAEDLALAFVTFARKHLAAGPLACYLTERVTLDRFDREDPRNREMAADAAVRIVFGSDESAAAVDALPHPPDSIRFAFSDRQSEAWIDPARADQETLSTLIKVFAIYGQAGCTSPRRVVVLDGTPDDARAICQGLVELWPRIIIRDVAMHVASQNVMTRQWAAAKGWHAVLAPRNAAVIAAGAPELEPVSGLMTLPIVSAPVEQACAQLPANIQTIGHALTSAVEPRWMERVASSRIKRFVPLRRMHHFGPWWDGFDFWKQLFELVEVGA
jgi:hypothetical protein